MKNFIEKHKQAVYAAIFVGLTLIVLVIAKSVNPMESKRNSIKKEVTKIAKEMNLDYKDIEVGDTKFSVDIVLNNFDDYSSEDMLKLIKEFDDKTTNKIRYIYNDDKSKKYQLSNGDRTLLLNDKYASGEKPTEKATQKQTQKSTYSSGSSSKTKSSSSGSSSGSSSSEKWVKETNDDYLGICWALAEKAVKNKLKSPSSAKFPFSYGSNGVSIQSSGNNYKVTAYVEAENSFGAKLKKNFVVYLTRSGTGKNAKFSVTSCDIKE